MKRMKWVAVATVISLVPAQVMASDAILQPLPSGAATVRYIQGVPTVDLHKDHGAVQITPLPMDHGSYAFSIAVLNQGATPANIDVTNVDVETVGQHYVVLSRSDLEHKAKKRAMWNSIALAAIGGVAAAAAASANTTDTYRGTTFTPHGTYRTILSVPNHDGQVLAAATAAATAGGIYAIQNQLDKTREMLGATTVQMTTVDPGDSYAGRIVVTKMKTGSLPQRVNMVVNWNGEAYPFAFQVAKRGTPQPVFPDPVPVAAAPASPVVSTAKGTATPTAAATSSKPAQIKVINASEVKAK